MNAILKLIYDYLSVNIFNFKKGDGIAYLSLYVVIPCFVTILSLANYPSDNSAKIYCYISIFINAVNCIYDAFNRWDNEKSKKNGKLFFMMLGAFIVTIYCTFVILSMAIWTKSGIRQDAFLCSYLIVIAIALIDVICCFTKEIAWWNLCK